MTGGVIVLAWWQLALAAGLILVNGVISVAWRLGLERTLALAAFRTVVQLLAVGGPCCRCWRS